MDVNLIAANWWSDVLLSNRTWGIALWVGLAALTVVLLVLMRTRWGQVRPLSKCVALSIGAHVLFVGYAYGTKLIFDAPAGNNDEIVSLIVVADEPQEHPDQPRPPRPWEQFARDEMVDPQWSPPLRQDAQTQSSLDRKTLAELPFDGKTPTSDAVAPSEPPREAAHQTQPNVLRISQSLADAAEIEKPVAGKQDDIEPAAAIVGGPHRIETTRPDDVLVEKPLERDVSGDVQDIQSRLHRLTDRALQVAAANAALDRRDATTHAANRADDAMQTDDPSRPSESSDQGDADQVADSANPSHQPGARLTGVRSDASNWTSSSDTEQSIDSAALPRRLGDGQPLPELYGLRSRRDRLQVAEQRGGSEETEAAVEAALKWLASIQSADGRWDASTSGAGLETRALGHDRHGAGAEADTGITGLALLAFMAAGNSHLEGDYRQTVQRGLEYLLRRQRSDGCLAGDARLYAAMYCHGMAALAISEAYALTGDYRLKPFVQNAVDYTVSAQHLTSGGWRYQPGDQDQGDMSQFGWQVMALKSAELAGVATPRRTRGGMGRFLQTHSSGSNGGLAKYRTSDNVSRTMTAEALLCRILLGAELNSATADEAASFVVQQPPGDGKANYYMWYYSTLALYQIGGEHWQTWNTALKKQLVARQRNEGPLAGSWDNDSIWGAYGGRVYTTAMATLCLEVYYRYLPMYRAD